MENNRARRYLEGIRNRNVIPESHKEDIRRYEGAGIIGRFIIRRREPEVFEHYERELRRRDFVRSQQSIIDARLHPDPDPSEVIIF